VRKEAARSKGSAAAAAAYAPGIGLSLFERGIGWHLRR
jgi:hypothetical protein